MAFIDRLPPVYKNDKYAYVSDAVITKKYRNKGIMKKMVSEAAKFFKRKGIREIGLRVYSKNITAVKAWSKIGFKESVTLVFMDIK
jgi:ribosomal protein S18 acetylase RimI-like enzyme